MVVLSAVGAAASDHCCPDFCVFVLFLCMGIFFQELCFEEGFFFFFSSFFYS